MSVPGMLLPPDCPGDSLLSGQSHTLTSELEADSQGLLIHPVG